MSVYLASSDRSFSALSADQGKLRWHSQPFGTSRAEIRPVVADGVVFLGRVDDVYALNASDGAVKWHYPTPGKVEVTSVLDRQVFGVRADNPAPGVTNAVFALNESTGALLWHYEVGNTLPEIVAG